MIQQYTPDEAVQESQHDIFIKLSDVLALLDVETEYATPIYDPYDSVGRERARLRAELGAE